MGCLADIADGNFGRQDDFGNTVLFFPADKYFADSAVVDVYKRQVAHRIWRMQADEEEYIYNAFAPLLAPFGREVNAYKAEICSQFVAQCLRTAGVLPKDFAEAFAEYLYYRGPLEQYRPAWAAAPAPDDYFLHLGWRRRTTEACKSVAVLMYRVYRAHRYKA